MVLNDHLLVEANALPVTSFAPVLISAKYLVFGEKSCSGSNIAVLLSGLRDKTPLIRVDSPSSALLIVNVFSLIVGLLIGSLNVAVISELTGTCIASSAGIVLSTFGTFSGSFSSAAAPAAFVTVAPAAAAAVAFSVADSAALVPK